MLCCRASSSRVSSGQENASEKIDGRVPTGSSRVVGPCRLRPLVVGRSCSAMVVTSDLRVPVLARRTCWQQRPVLGRHLGSPLLGPHRTSRPFVGELTTG